MNGPKATGRSRNAQSWNRLRGNSPTVVCWPVCFSAHSFSTMSKVRKRFRQPREMSSDLWAVRPPQLFSVWPHAGLLCETSVVAGEQRSTTCSPLMKLELLSSCIATVCLPAEWKINVEVFCYLLRKKLGIKSLIHTAKSTKQKETRNSILSPPFTQSPDQSDRFASAWCIFSDLRWSFFL